MYERGQLTTVFSQNISAFISNILPAVLASCLYVHYDFYDHHSHPLPTSWYISSFSWHLCCTKNIFLSSCSSPSSLSPPLCCKFLLSICDDMTNIPAGLAAPDEPDLMFMWSFRHHTVTWRHDDHCCPASSIYQCVRICEPLISHQSIVPAVAESTKKTMTSLSCRSVLLFRLFLAKMCPCLFWGSLKNGWDNR